MKLHYKQSITDNKMLPEKKIPRLSRGTFTRGAADFKGSGSSEDWSICLAFAAFVVKGCLGRLPNICLHPLQVREESMDVYDSFIFCCKNPMVETSGTSGSLKETQNIEAGGGTWWDNPLSFCEKPIISLPTESLAWQERNIKLQYMGQKFVKCWQWVPTSEISAVRKARRCNRNHKVCKISKAFSKPKN